MRELRAEEIKLLRIMAIQNDVTKLQCGIYARKSREDKTKSSLDTQVDECKTFIQANHQLLTLNINAIHKEDDVSGFTIEGRDELEKLVRKVEAGSIHVIVISKDDRFSRSIGYGEMLRIRIDKAHGYLIIGDEIGDSSSVGIFMNQVLRASGEFQVRRSAEDVMKVHTKQVKDGLTVGGPGNYGYDVKDRKYVINPEEAAVVDIVYDMFLKGSSYSDIRETLETKGYKSRSGKLFSNSTIHSILTNQRNCGISVWNSHAKRKKRERVVKQLFDEVVSEDVVEEAIIDRATFNRVQEVLSTRKIGAKGGSNSNYLLTGILKCECGSAMSGNSQRCGRAKKIQVTYQCRNHLKKHGGTCGTKNLNAKYLETYVQTLVTKLVNDRLSVYGVNQELLNGLLNQEQKRLSRQRRELATLNDRLEKMTIALYDCSSDSVRKATTKAIESTTLNIEKIENSIKFKENSIKQLKTIHGVSGIKFTKEQLFANRELGRRLIFSLIDEIKVNNKDINITLK